MIVCNLKIYILSDKKGIGKTTSLQKWVKINPQLKGFLTPLVNGKRMFQIIETNDFIPMETKNKNLKIGRYIFDKNSFDKVEKIILKSLFEENSKTIIVDEIGPLEINKNKGFHDLVLKLINGRNFNSDLFFVVRESCLKNFIVKYKPTHFEILNLKEFNNRFLKKSQFT